MGDIHGHADFVHALHNGDAEVRQTVVAALGRAIADQRARIVGKLRDTLAEAVEIIDVIHLAKML